MTVNINEILHNGQIIKNYKEMVLLLGDEERKGSPRERQINSWNRYFKFHKEKQKYIIDEVYDMPLEKEAKVLKGNHSIYIKYIETILLYLLSKQKDQTMVCTKNYLLVALGITGNNYIDSKERRKLVKAHKFTQKEIDDFDNRAYKVLDRILFSALNNLQRRCLLNWYQELHISAYDETIEKSIEWVATPDDVRNFTAVKYEILKQMGIDEDKPEKYDSLRDIYFYHQTEKFYELLQDKLYDLYNWDTTAIYYRIIYKTENVIDAIPRTEGQLSKILSDNKMELNEKVVDALNNNAETRYNNLLKKFQDEYNLLCYINNQNPDDFPYDYKEIDCYYPNNNYVKVQQEITEKLIRLTPKDKKVHPSKQSNNIYSI